MIVVVGFSDLANAGSFRPHGAPWETSSILSSRSASSFH